MQPLRCSSIAADKGVTFANQDFNTNSMQSSQICLGVSGIFDFDSHTTVLRVQLRMISIIDCSALCLEITILKQNSNREAANT